MYINFGGVIMIITIFSAGVAVGAWVQSRLNRKRPKGTETTEIPRRKPGAVSGFIGSGHDGTV